MSLEDVRYRFENELEELLKDKINLKSFNPAAFAEMIRVASYCFKTKPNKNTVDDMVKQYCYLATLAYNSGKAEERQMN